MANYTQILNLSATGAPTAAAGGAVVLALKFTASNTPGSPFGTTVVSQPAATATGIAGVYQDSNGNAVVTTAITHDNAMASSDTLMNYTLSTNRASLENIGLATSYTVGAKTFVVGTLAGNYADAPAALAAAMDELLTTTVDAIPGAGGRAAIQLVGIDGRTGGSYDPLTNKFNLATNTSTINNNLAVAPSMYDVSPQGSPEGQGDSGQLFVSTVPQLSGIMRLMTTIIGDPAISGSGHINVFAWNGVIKGGATLAAGNSGFMPSGFFELDELSGLPFGDNAVALMGPIVSIPSKIAVAAGTSLAPQYVSYPLDAATINAFGAAGANLDIYLNLAPQTASSTQKLVQNFVSINLAQADALINNSCRVYSTALDPVMPPSSGISSDSQTTGELPLTFSDVFKIRDSVQNIQSMTVEAASSLTNVKGIFIEGQGGPGHFAPAAIEIIPLNITGGLDTVSLINLDFGVAQIFANSGFMISQQAKVNVSIANGFGTVTGEDIQALVRAGVDKIGFDNTFTPATTAVPAVGTTPAIPAKPASDPFAGLGVRQVIIDQNQLNDVAKLSISGLTAVINGKLTDNKSIDVVVNVDDSNGSVNIPSTLLTKLGVDRIVASDGNLDLSLNDVRNLTKTGVLLGTLGDNSDVTLHVDKLRDLSSFKVPTMQKFAASGVDVISVALADDFQPEANLSEMALYGSLSQSKAMLDALSAAKVAGLGFDMGGTDVGISLSSIMVPGAGASLVNGVNLLGRLSVGTVSRNLDNEVTENILTISSTGIKDNWIEISDMSRMSSEGQVQTLAMLTKAVAKANSAGLVMLKAGTGVLDGMNSMDSTASGLYDTLYNHSGTNEELVSNMKTFGNLIKGIKNVYVDFSVSSSDNMLINSDAANMDGNATDFQDAFLTNFSKLGIRGIVVDDNVINDYLTLEEGVGIDLGYDIAQHLPISEMAQTLDVIYQLDADSVTSSVGLSMYLYEDGGIYLNDGPKYKDEYFSFRSNVNAIDKIVITNAANGDMSLDLSELGLYGANTDGTVASNFNSVVSRVSGEPQDTFHLAASNGRDVVIQIVGLADYRQFTASDLKEGMF